MRKDVFEQLYRRYHRPAYLYVLTLCKNPELAEDLVADAFVKAYLSLPDEVPSFPYWLLRVSKNLWIDHLRKEKHRAGSEIPECLAADGTPEDALFLKERNAALYRNIAEMRQEEQELLTLFYFVGLPVKDLASLTGDSQGNVKIKLYRARQKLKRRMEENGYGIS